jgi:CBS domain-containing protein
MIKALKERGPETPVLDVMQSDVPTVPARAKLDTALRSLMQKGRPVVGVTGADGRLIGLLTVENLGEMMMIQAARPDMPSGPWGDASG